LRIAVGHWILEIVCDYILLNPKCHFDYHQPGSVYVPTLACTWTSHEKQVAIFMPAYAFLRRISVIHVINDGVSSLWRNHCRYFMYHMALAFVALGRIIVKYSIMLWHPPEVKA
jgi:hypothetical protein